MDVKSQYSAGQLIQLLEDGKSGDFLNAFLAADEDAYSDVCKDNHGNDYHMLQEEHGGSTVNALREADYWADEFKNEPYFNIDGVHLAIEDEEGGDGEGSLVTLILKVTRKSKNVAFIRLTAYHSSYDSTEWEVDEGELVEPREVMVTKYFAIDGSDDE
jgi:hypothetical protein